MHIQGPVPLGDDDYETRPFEVQIIKEVQAARWVLLLGPRQHGKTSALLRLRDNLSKHGTTTALVDLQRAPPFDSFTELVTWFGRSVAVALDNSAQVDDTDDLSTALTAALPAGNSIVVVLIDQASNISNKDWCNSFYGQLRAIANDRAIATAGGIALRLRFVFVGTFRPERLVAEANSPFNTCERIEPTDLTLHNVQDLAARAGLKHPDSVAGIIYEEVGGQPFLNQKLILATVGEDDEVSAVRREIEILNEGASDHVTKLFAKIVSDSKLEAIVASVVEQRKIAFEPGNEDQRYLVVLGLLRRERGFLYFRNTLYEKIACRSAQFSKVAVAHLQRAVLFPLQFEAFSRLTDAHLKEIGYSAQIGAVAAYQSGSNRLALAGFGTALEAVLIDFLKQRSPADLNIAASHTQNRSRSFIVTDPETWRLVDLIQGTRGLLRQAALDIPDNLREWRNLIHPAVAIKAYRADADLTPEVGVAASQLQIILRDLP